eukprot:IDg13220t1
MCAAAGVTDVVLPATNTTSGKLSLREAGTNGRLVILYFYPRDDTPGCTCEAKDFRDFKGELEGLDVAVIGVSPDPVESHEKFSSKYDLNFPLVSDDGSLADAFSVWKNHPVFGKVISRSTFVLRDGSIIKEWRAVSSTGHAAEVVSAVKKLAA